MLIVASIWYLALTTILTIIQSRLEKRMSRGVSRSGPSAEVASRARMARDAR